MVVLWRPVEPIGAENVTATPEPQRDDNGDPIEGTAEPFDITGCALWPKGTSEDNFRAAVTTEDLVLVAPVYETDLKADMKIEWRNKVYAIDGEPAPWLFLDGTYAGTQANLRRGS